MPLSNKQKAYIRKNYKSLSTEKISENLNAQISEVNEFINTIKITKKYPVWFYIVPLLIPIIFFILFEISLTIGGYGKDFSTFITISEDYKDKWFINPDLPFKYFSNISSPPSVSPDAFDKIKKENAIRIFVLGGSSAAGWPFNSNASFPREIKRRLQILFPENEIEVINMGVSAINSYSIKDILPDVIDKDPDLVIIYAGHNEFYGALGVGSSESLGNFSFIINSIISLREYRTVQLIRDFLSYFAALFADEQKLAQGENETLMSRMVGEALIPYQSDLFNLGIKQFQNNFDDILSKLKEKEIPVLIGTLTSNLKIKPFVSVETNNQRKADDVFNEAESFYKNGNYNIAREFYIKAKDLDALRFRAPEILNETIVNLAEKYKYDVVKIDSLFFAESPNGIDHFKFWKKPIELPQTEIPDTNVYDMRLTKHEDGWVYGVFCTERKDTNAPQDTTAAIANAGEPALQLVSSGYVSPSNLLSVPGKNKDLFFRSRLLYQWDKEGKCPKFLTWLDSSLRKGQGRLIQAFSRALLTGYTSGERFLHLVGPGGTGKSTMQQLMIALAGFNSTHTSSLELIETNKFESYNLIGKRLLLLTDESNYNKRMDVLKKLTSASDTLRAERKYGKEIISFKPECLVCIASNEHISSNDSTSGLERRRLTIVMDQVVPPSQRRELLSVYGDRLEGDFVEELPGIVSWALSMPFEEMRDVLANPVKHAPSLARTNIDALVFNNQYVAWMSECCLYAPNSATVVGRGAARPSTDESEKGMYVKNAYSELYASYANFCKSCGYKPAAKPRFVERTMETLCNILKLPHCTTTSKNGLAAIKGLRLKPFDLTSDRASHGDTRLPNPVEFAQNPEFAIWENSFNKHDANT